MHLLSAQTLWMAYIRILMTKTETVSFLTIDTTLPASNHLRFRKNYFLSYKNDSS